MGITVTLGFAAFTSTSRSSHCCWLVEPTTPLVEGTSFTCARDERLEKSVYSELTTERFRQL
jgi:hypothetical protein